MNIDRQTVEDVLDALIYHTNQARPIHETDKTISKLRAALAQPASAAVPENCGTSFCSCIECVRDAEPGPASAAVPNREQIMLMWDNWRKAIANGDKGSWLWDEFEALLDALEGQQPASKPFIA